MAHDEKGIGVERVDSLQLTDQQANATTLSGPGIIILSGPKIWLHDGSKFLEITTT